MAMEYIVMKGSAELKTYKSLPAAKTLAEKEGAEVFVDGECVYPIPTTDPVENAVPTAADEKTVEEQKPVSYTLARKMTVRKEPSLTAEKLKVLDGGTVVDVAEVKDDWLYLTDGTLIYYEGGRNAVR